MLFTACLPASIFFSLPLNTPCAHTHPHTHTHTHTHSHTHTRTQIGRKHKLGAREVYPDELGIVARYKGEGRVAQKGYTQPRWVDGELLVFSSGGGAPLTENAELGFVWAVPGERRFLILLNKIDLAACLERGA